MVDDDLRLAVAVGIQVGVSVDQMVFLETAEDLLRFHKTETHSTGNLTSVIPPGRLANPDVAFFARVNPGHEAGDELVCLTTLDDDNLTRAGRRMLARGRRLCELEVAA